MLPTDKSKPSTAKVTVTPIPNSATTATDCNTLSKLLIRKNAGSRDRKKRISAVRTKKMAYRRREGAEKVRNGREGARPRAPGTRCGSIDVFESLDRETSATSETIPRLRDEDVI